MDVGDPAEMVRPVAGDGEFAASGLPNLLDLSKPQGNYRALIEQGGYIAPMEGMGVSFDRASTDHVLRNHALFSSRVEMNLGNVRPLIPLNVDPPQHSKYRKLLDPLFAPRRMEEQEADITIRVNNYIDGFIERGSCNFTEEFAELLPSSVFLGLLGLPEGDLRLLLDMRDGILHPEKIDPEALGDFQKRQAVVNATGEQIYRYCGALVDQRASSPAADIVSRFLAADVGGDKLSKEDILDILFLFIIAGLDTVSDSLTCLFAFLATHPEHRKQLVENPDLIPSAVEELLRWESPVPTGVPRVAAEDTTLPNGTYIKAGTAVLVSYGAANVDPRIIDHPFEVRFDRSPNPHIAFGAGVHRCLGSHLARRELRIALREWHRRIPDYHLAAGHEQLEYPPGLRHVKDLTLSWK